MDDDISNTWLHSIPFFLRETSPCQTCLASFFILSASDARLAPDMKPQKFFIFVSSVFQSGFLARRALFRIETEKATLSHFFLRSQSFSKFSLLFSLSSEVKEREGGAQKFGYCFEGQRGPPLPFSNLSYFWKVAGCCSENKKKD